MGVPGVGTPRICKKLSPKYILISKKKKTSVLVQAVQKIKLWGPLEKVPRGGTPKLCKIFVSYIQYLLIPIKAGALAQAVQHTDFWGFPGRRVPPNLWPSICQ